MPETEIITFRTMGTWTTSDLALFTRSVALIYDARLAVEVGKRLYIRDVADLPLIMGPFILVTSTQIYQSLEYYVEEGARCHIYRVRMGSPGEFNFTGIGEIVKEFRELVKDIWYRNRQENILGKMAIVERYLSMRERFREEHAGTPFLSSVSSEAELCKVVTDGLNGIEELEQRGKLAGVPDYIAVTPREPT